jgi:protease-4
MRGDKQGERRGNFLAGGAVQTIVRIVAVGVFTISLLFSLLFIIFILVGVTAVSGRRGDHGYPGYQKVYLEAHKPVRGVEASNEFLVLSISGIITEYDQRNGIWGNFENPVSAVHNRLALARDDKNIRGVLLVIDSPGGGVTASDVMFNDIMRFREDTGMPIVVLMKQVAASGGYYVAAAGDTIVAYPTAITGSIGVISFNFNFAGLMEKYGIAYVPVKTSDEKDSMSPFKPVQEGEIEVMQGIVDSMLDRFIDAIDEGRANLSREEIETLADGRVYIASDALERGLIDRIGYFDDAVQILAEKSGVRDPVLMQFEREINIMDVISRASVSLPRSIFQRSFPYMSMLFENGGSMERGLEFYYLWDAVLTQP